MHFKSLITLGLIGTTVSSPFQSIPLEKRDITAIQLALTSISKSISILDSSIRSLTAHPNSTLLVSTNSQTVLRTIDMAAATVRNSQPISILDAVNLQDTGTQLTNMVMTTIKDLTARRATIEKGGAITTTLQGLMLQKNASTLLGDAIQSRVPGLAAQQAKMQAGIISMAFDMGIMAFEQQPKSQISC
jgi:nitrous oxidase accessory protein NosD